MNSLTIRELMIQLITQTSSSDEDCINRISEILKKRTGEKFANNVDKWIEWYLNSQTNEEDKRVVEASYKLFKREKSNVL